MDREVVLAVLATFLCGPVVLIGGLLRWKHIHTADSPTESEGRAWNRLWLPLLPAVLLLAMLVGWAFQEPAQSDERVLTPNMLVAILFGLLWLRAVVRAVRSLARRPNPTAAGTIGLFRPTVIVSPMLRIVLDEQALRAAIEHEAAHARHRDPLRIWLAQIATDLQWPSPAARTRFATWRRCLEIARDAEACARGIDGADLAAAIVTSAQHAQQAQSAFASIADAPADADADAALRERIDRLLGAPASVQPVRAAWIPWALVAVAIAGSITLGVVDGDVIVRALPGVAT